MAFDEWMFDQVLATPGLALLRLYTWREPALTFGCNQQQDAALDGERVGKTPVIRRVTGGRALLHDVSELTYSIALNPHHPSRQALAGSVATTSQIIATGLAAFLNRIGFDGQIVRRSSSQNAKPDFFHTAPCSASQAKWEIQSSSHKIVASAQRQISGVLLQHGAIKLNGWAKHPALDPDASQSGSLSGQKPIIEETEFLRLAEIFRCEVGVALAIEFEPVDVSPADLKELHERAKKLADSPFEVRDRIKQTIHPNSQ